MVCMVSYYEFSGPFFSIDPWPDRSLTDVPNAPLGFFWGYSGKWENEEILPRRLVSSNETKTDETKLKHLFLSGGRWCVDAVFRSVVEELEPGQHQFMPLTLVDQDGSVVQKQYYMFNAIGWHDLVKDIEAKNPTPPFGRWTAAIPKALIPSAHCWRDHYSTTQLFMSEVLFNRLRAAGINNLRSTELEEI